MQLITKERWEKEAPPEPKSETDRKNSGLAAFFFFLYGLIL